MDLNYPGDNPDFINQVLEVIGQEVKLGKDDDKIRKDVTTWLAWLLVGGTRPTFTKRTGQVYGYVVTRDTLLLALTPYVDFFYWDNPTHFALLERITRPLGQTKMDQTDDETLKNLRKQS